MKPTNEETDKAEDGLGAHLRRLRTARGFSLGVLSKGSGVHKSTLSRWESGVQQPGIPELEAVLTTLTVAPDERRHLLQQLGASGAPRALRLLRDERRAEAVRSHLPLPLSLSLLGGGSLLRALRSRRGWSQEQAAAHLGLHSAAISRWENGEAWPETERLQLLCLLLKATPEETQVLLSGQPGLSENIGVDVLENRFRLNLAPVMLVSELYPGLDLTFIALESSLWEHAVHHASVRPLLGEVYAHHANYLRNNQRFIEAGVYAEKALAVGDSTPYRTPLPQHPDWVETAAVCAADAVAKGGKRPQPRRGEEILRWWLTRRQVSAPHAAWMLRKISDYQCDQQRFAEAIESLHAADRLSESIEQSTPEEASQGRVNLDSRLEVRRYMAGTLLAAGRWEESQRWLPEAVESYPVNRLRDALLWAEAHRRVGHKSEAHEWTARAFTEVSTHGLAHRLPDVERIATLL